MENMGNGEENNSELIVVNPEEVVETPTTNENTETQTAEENEEGLNNTDIIVDGEKDNIQTPETNKEKMFTQSELERIVKDRVWRATSKEKAQLKELQNILSAGMGTNSVEESKEKLKEFYEGEGVKIPEMSTYDEADIETLAKSDASRVIDCGYDEIVHVVDELNDKGLDKMSMREKYLFRELANERKNQESIKELKSLGVTEDILNDANFKGFANKFDSSKVSTKEIYEMYKKMLPQKEAPKPIGSMKNNNNSANIVKDYYSKEEAKKFSREDFDKNQKLFKAVCDSMPRW